jgi:hydroxymethylbilane synthase
VHSSKDLPASLPDGLSIIAALEREDPRDVLILAAGRAAGDLPAVKRTLGPAPRIGTSSVRRAAELRALFPDAVFTPVRGNVDTRLRKLDAGECDALVLAAAGLKRLGLASRITAWLPAGTCVPAPGQGIVAVEAADDCAKDVRVAVARISDADAMTAFIAERAVVQSLGGGCQMPLGVLATLDGQDLVLEGLVASLDGRRVIRAVVHGNRGGAAAAGEKLAARLCELGAATLLAAASQKEA